MKLVFLEEAGRIRQETLKPAGAMIGRDGAADIAMNDPDVSRQHCLVMQKGEAWQVEDLGSVNGVLVNGIRIVGLQTLKPGDCLRLGTTELFFLEDQAALPAGLMPADERPALQTMTFSAGKTTRASVAAGISASEPPPTSPLEPKPVPICPAKTPPPPMTSHLAAPSKMVQAMLLANALVIVLVLGFVGYLAKTVWLPEKQVWVVPTPDGGELLMDGKPIMGPTLLPENASLTIRKSGFAEQGFSLANPGTVELTKFMPSPGSVLVTSSPAGAAVCLGGKHLGRTPCVLSSLPAGPCQLMVGGQDTRTKPMTVAGNDKAGTTVFIQLESLSCTAEVVTTTPGCEILVNGIKTGKIGSEKEKPVPLKIDNLYPGIYQIQAVTANGKTKEVTVTLAEQQYQQISIAI